MNRTLVPIEEWGQCGDHGGIDKATEKADTAIENLQAALESALTVETNATLASVQAQLTIGCELVETGDGLAIEIGVDDTIDPKYSGGPCSGFAAFVQIKSLAANVIDEWNTLDLNALGLEEKETRNEVFETWTKYLEAEAAKLRKAMT